MASHIDHPQIQTLITTTMPHKAMVIIRGISGSGKTTLARDLGKHCFNKEVLSADDFFMDAEGDYNYDSARQGEAHQQCLSRVLRAMTVHREAPSHAIILHNTATRLWEYQAYMYLAECVGYAPLVIDLLADTVDAIRTCVLRCTKKGLTESAVAAQALRFERDKRPSTITLPV